MLLLESLFFDLDFFFLFLRLDYTFTFQNILFWEKVLTHLANGIAGVSFPSRAFKPPLLGNLNASVKCPSVHAEGRATRHKQCNASRPASPFSQMRFIVMTLVM